LAADLDIRNWFCRLVHAKDPRRYAAGDDEPRADDGTLSDPKRAIARSRSVRAPTATVTPPIAATLAVTDSSSTSAGVRQIES
jgi:hypothetical protein